MADVRDKLASDETRCACGHTEREHCSGVCCQAIPQRWCDCLEFVAAPLPEPVHGELTAEQVAHKFADEMIENLRHNVSGERKRRSPHESKSTQKESATRPRWTPDLHLRDNLGLLGKVEPAKEFPNKWRWLAAPRAQNQRRGGYTDTLDEAKVAVEKAVLPPGNPAVGDDALRDAREFFDTWILEWRKRNPDGKWLAGGDAINFGVAYARSQAAAEQRGRVEAERERDALRKAIERLTREGA